MNARVRRVNSQGFGEKMPGKIAKIEPAMAETTHMTIPKQHAVFEAVMEDGAIIRARRHGIAGAPRLVLSHGNALAIDATFRSGDSCSIATT